MSTVLRRVGWLVVLMCLGVVFSSEAQTPLPSHDLIDVIGQRDVNQTAFNTVIPNRGMHLGGVHVHSYADGTKVFYAYDSGNNRIVAFRNPNFTTGTTLPDLIFGQTDGVNNACNGNNTDNSILPTAQTLCLNRGEFAISQEEEPRFSSMETDDNGNFFVIDQYNNRVLMFLDPFGTDVGEGDTTADDVWGQHNFTSKSCNHGTGYPYQGGALSSSSLCLNNSISNSIDPRFVTSLERDHWKNLWVTDIINNRVLRYPYNPLTGLPAKTADIVIGQGNANIYQFGFNGCNVIPEGTGVCQLISLQINPATGQLFVVNGYDHIPRITVYQPNTNAASPTQFTFLRTIGKNQLLYPGFIQFLDADRFIIEDEPVRFNDGLRVYTDEGVLLKTLGSGDVVGSTPDGPVLFPEIHGQISLVGNILYLTEQRRHNSILAFDLSQMDVSNDLLYAGEIFGGPNDTHNSITGLGLTSPFGLTISHKHRQIFVSDNYRVLVWNMVDGVSYAGRPADYVIGQPNMTTKSQLSSGPFVFRDKVGGTAVDDTHDKLWVARQTEIFAFNLPVMASSPLPVRQFIARGTGRVVGNLPVLGQSQNLSFRVTDVAINPIDKTLWLVDIGKSRVVQVINPYTAPTVTLIVGQATIAGESCNHGVYAAPTAKTICFPASAEFDRYGNLYVAEGVYEGRADMPGNKRIVQFDNETIRIATFAGVFSEPVADRVYGVRNFTTSPLFSFPSLFTCVIDTPCNPISIGFDPWNRMAVLSDAYFNAQKKRIYIYRDPLKNEGYIPFNMIGDLRVPLSTGQGGFSAFSMLGELFAQDHTWNRVLVMKINMPNIVNVSTPAIDVVEATSTDSYTLQLAVQPVSPVAVRIDTADNVVASPDRVVFTPDTWNIPQTITISVLEDAIYYTAPYTSTITHRTITHDRSYRSSPIPSVTVNITDNSTPPGMLGEVINGGFDVGQPDAVGWTKNTHQLSGVACGRNDLYQGECALRLVGESKSVIYRQSLLNAPQAGQLVTFSLWAKWSDIRAGGFGRVRLNYADGTSDTATISFPNSPRTNPLYQNFTANVLAAQPVISAEVILNYSANGGTIWVDDVSVVYSTPSARTAPESGEAMPLPPAPPDGFRGSN